MTEENGNGNGNGNGNELLAKIKEMLGYQAEAAIDNMILPRMEAAAEYMRGAGVPEEKMESSLGIGALSIGVNDLWNLQSGEVKFSHVFVNLVAQLAAGGGNGEA